MSADSNADEVLKALRLHVAQGPGMTGLARLSGLKRSHLYRALGKTGNPTLPTLLRICEALDLQLCVGQKGETDLSQ